MNNNRLMIVALVMIWLSASLQQGLAFRMSIFGAQPDFLFVSACILGLLCEARIALVVGFLIGFAESAIVGADMWQFILTRMAAAWICAFLVESRFQRNGGVAAAAALICSLICGLVFMILTAQPNIGGTLKATLITAMYNAVLAIVAYYPIERAAGVTGQQL
jgi:cell shape-determining protein MreD